MQARRQRLIDSFRKRPDVDRLLKGLARTCDQALQAVAKRHPLPPGATLAAIGGYGRAEMYPHSDVDVLVLLADEPGACAIGQIERFVAAMWDAGLEAAHSVRTVSQCLDAAERDHMLETALLEARWLSGGQDQLDRLLRTLREGRDPQAFFLAKQAEMHQRHAHYHHAAYALEPNCKESPGALRDLQLLSWVARVAGYGDTWPAMVASGVLTTEEYRALRRALRAFQRLRIELHLLTGRREDRLLFQYQPALARTYGLTGALPQTASEQLMQRYYWAARRVRQLTVILMQSIEETLFPSDATRQPIDVHFQQVGNRLDMRDEQHLTTTPSLIFRACLIIQQRPSLQGMSARLLRGLWHARKHVDAAFRQQASNRDLFLQILRQPSGVADALARLNAFNILPRYIPAFRRIVGQMQHDLFHVYTVDEHTLKVVRNLARFRVARHAGEYPQASQLATEFDSPWLLYIAAIFHDIAKGQGGNHAARGAGHARRFALDHGLSEADTDLIVFLVTHHLNMSHTAQKRDLSDPDVIRDFAVLTGSKQYLDALYLLTVADIRATRPNLWNAWKGKLLDDLYQRTLIALEGNLPDTRAVVNQRKAQTREEARALGLPMVQLDALWKELDPAYFMRHEAHDMLWHAEQLAGRLQTDTALVRARAIGQNEALQVLVWVADQPDLFSRICQYFEYHGLSIQDARIHTTAHGYALDSFVAVSNQEGIRYGQLAGIIQKQLASFLDGASTAALDMAPPAASPVHGWTRQRQAQVFPIRPQVSMTHLPDTGQWELSVTGTDRPGLLHDLGKIFNRHGIDLKMAKIHTLGQRVEDSFILQGKALAHAGSRCDFEQALLDALQNGPSPH